ncbi:hypothetical protein SLPG_00050 [Salicola phage CGphi29]|uniref:hypothetical protein n=1 Tax=Salicola phage CGphi29 TaxID=754067 RepID=UPI0002C11E06|nr:hypothetical protein SLPG_00050 [Salicola phage CGphi29]AGH31844.1 hypothetical protein SLPG_00050 [Salicola phage CGphi29]
MQTIQFDSDQNSRLNQLRWAFYIARQAWVGANRSGSGKSQAAAELNRARARLRRYLYDGADTYVPHHETTIHGIPCGIVVESYTPGKPWRQHTFPGAGPGDCEPPEPSEAEWFVVDRHGYRADWLMDKLTPRDVREIEEEMGL